MPMQPRPIADTSSSRPSVRVCMMSSSSGLGASVKVGSIELFPLFGEHAPAVDAGSLAASIEIGDPPHAEQALALNPHTDLSVPLRAVDTRAPRVHDIHPKPRPFNRIDKRRVPGERDETEFCHSCSTATF